MRQWFVVVTLAVSSLALAGNALAQTGRGQKQRSSMDTFLQWSSNQVNQLRNSCSRWMTEIERRWSDSNSRYKNSTASLTEGQKAEQGGMGQAMRTGTVLGTGGGRRSGSSRPPATGNASGRGKRGNSVNGLRPRGQTNGRRSNGKGRGNH